MQGVARDVTYLCPYSGPARGVLTVTNYKLHFRSTDRDTPYTVDVPLGVVSTTQHDGEPRLIPQCYKREYPVSHTEVVLEKMRLDLR